MKTCTRCHLTMRLDQFYKQRGGLFGVHSICKKCETIRRTATRKNNPAREHNTRAAYNEKNRDKLSTYRWKIFIVKTYGITPEQYQKMFESQGGVCKICRTPPSGKWSRLHIDHDHAASKVRGLLCSKCNTAIGLMNDDAKIMRRAIRYLREAKC